jgi:hypothetical protein
MREDIRKQLENMFQQTQAGFFGAEAQKHAQRYANLSNDFEVFYTVLQDFYVPVDNDNATLFETIDLIAQLLMIVYRETKIKNPSFAAGYLHSLIMDFPGTNGTALASKWQHAASASINFRSLLNKQPDGLSIWNAFLAGLLGYLIIGWQIVKGKSFSLKTFNNTYGNKVEVFSQLTDGDNGVFYIIHRIANPPLRNAIAHGDAYLNQSKGEIVYSDGKDDKRKQFTIAFIDFMTLVTVGSHVPRAYFAAIAAIIVYECDGTRAKKKLPAHIYRLLNSPPLIK